MSGSVLVCLDSKKLEQDKDLAISFQQVTDPALFWKGTAFDARSLLEKESVKECWVGDVSDMPAINLAAALKHDAKKTPVYLMPHFTDQKSVTHVQEAKLSGYKNREDLLRLITSYCIATRRAQMYRSEDPWEEESVSKTAPQVQGDKIRTVDSSTGSCRVSEQGIRAQYSIQTGAPAINHHHSGSQPQQADAARVGTRNQSDYEPQIQDRQKARTPRSQFSVVGKKAFVLVVAGAQGACGKSSVASLAAFRGQAWGYKTLIIDADLQFGDLKYLCSSCPSISIEDLVRSPHLMRRLVPSGDYPALISAPAVAERAEILAKELPKIIDAASQVFDFIVVNTGSFWAEEQAILFELASQVLFLVDQRPGALRSAEHALQMCARCNIATRSFIFALNRVSKQSVLKVLDIQGCFEGLACVELRDGGTDVEICLAAGKPLDLIRSGNQLVVSLDAILRDILPCAQARQISMPNKDLRARNKKRLGLRGKAACLC